MKNLNPMTKFAMFAYNYPHNFIDMIWEGRMAEHYKQKFISYYNEFGAKAVMVKFYMELDTDAQDKLAAWISIYYK